MNKYRKEWEEKKPPCPECKGNGEISYIDPSIQVEVSGLCPTCRGDKKQPYEEYLESKLEKIEEELRKCNSGFEYISNFSVCDDIINISNQRVLSMKAIKGD